MKDLLREASNEQELREAVQAVGQWMLVGGTKDRWEQAPDLLEIIVGKSE